MKFRVGRYPVAHEAALLEKIRADLPDGVVLMADGNAGYTLPRALEMGRVLGRSGSSGSRSRCASATVRGLRAAPAALDIALAGGEILQTRSAAIEFLGRRAVDIVQPEPVICGGIAETLWIAELAAVHSIAAMPHTSNNALGHRGGPAGARLPAEPDPVARVGRAVPRGRRRRQPAPDRPPRDAAAVRGRLGDDPRRARARRRDRRGVPAPPRHRDTVVEPPGRGPLDRVRGSARRGARQHRAAAGAERHRRPDATGSPAGGRSRASTTSSAPSSWDDEGIEARIDDLDGALRARGSVPATWWVGPSTTPADLARRLVARGFVEADAGVRDGARWLAGSSTAGSPGRGATPARWRS